MAAGLGFKDFTTGEVLTAGDVDGYLMQGIWVFASAAARDAAVTSPQEGNFAFLKDTNTTTYYTGSAWTNLDTTGMVNPMTTTGDTIYSSSGSTPARLGIGTAGQVLQVNSGATAPEWATISSGGMTLIQETVANADTSITFGSIPGTYKQLMLTWHGLRHSSSGNQFGLRINNSSSTVYYSSGFGGGAGGAIGAGTDDTTSLRLTAGGVQSQLFGNQTNTTTLYQDAKGILILDNYASTTKLKTGWASYSYYVVTASGTQAFDHNFTFDSTSAVTSLDIFRSTGTGTISNATNTSIRLYGIS